MKRIVFVLALSACGQAQGTSTPSEKVNVTDNTPAPATDGQQKPGTGSQDPGSGGSDRPAQSDKAKTPVSVTGTGSGSGSGETGSAVATVGTALKLTSDTCTDPDLSKVAKDVTFMLCDGTIGTGTYEAPAAPVMPAACAAFGQTGCVANDSFKSTDLTALVATNIKAGVTIAGVTGTVVEANLPSCNTDGQKNCVLASGNAFVAVDKVQLQGSSGNIWPGVVIGGVTGTLQLPAANVIKAGTTILGGNVTGTYDNKPADCSASDQVGCVTTTAYKSVDATNLTAANVKKGVTIGSVTGDYPSVSHPLTGSSGAALTASNMNARLADSATTFEWFAADGTRYSSTGDANLKPASFYSNITIFGVTGSVAAPNAWDVRAGVTIGGQAGKLDYNCFEKGTCTGGDTAVSGETTNWAMVYGSFVCGSMYCITKDMNTGLYFMKSPGLKTHLNASNYCNSFASDPNQLPQGAPLLWAGWRLPTLREVQLAMANGFPSFTAPATSVLFPNTKTIWTSERYYLTLTDTPANATLAPYNGSDTHDTICVHD